MNESTEFGWLLKSMILKCSYEFTMMKRTLKTLQEILSIKLCKNRKSKIII